MHVKKRLMGQGRAKAKRLISTNKQIIQVSKTKSTMNSIGSNEPNKPADEPIGRVEPSEPNKPINEPIGKIKPNKPISKEWGKNKPKWANLSINRNWIVAETDSSNFVEMPIGTRLEGYGFWHPKKLFREKDGLELSFHYGFTFKMMKYAEKKDGVTGPLPVLSVFMLGPNELLEAFDRIS